MRLARLNLSPSYKSYENPGSDIFLLPLHNLLFRALFYHIRLLTFNLVNLIKRYLNQGFIKIFKIAKIKFCIFY